MRKTYWIVRTHLQNCRETHIPDDIVGILPKWPDRVNHDLGLVDRGFDRRIISDVNYEEPDFMTKLELSLELF